MNEDLPILIIDAILRYLEKAPLWVKILFAVDCVCILVLLGALL